MYMNFSWPSTALRQLLVLLFAFNLSAQVTPFATTEHGYMRLDGSALQRRANQRRMAPRVLGAKELLLSAPGLKGGVPPQTFSLLNLLPYIATDRDQGACGNCWVWASTAMAEVALKVEHQISDRLSIQYFNSNKTDQFACNGGTLTDFTNWYTNTGTTNNAHPGTLVPWSNPGGLYRDGIVGHYSASSLVPPDQTGRVPSYTGATMNPATVQTPSQSEAIANIQAALLNHQAVGFSFFTHFAGANGFDAFWENQDETVLWRNSYEGLAADSSWGGHMVVIVGYDASDTVNPKNNYWIVLNSWGTTVGRPAGLFRLPMNIAYDALYSYDDGSGVVNYPCYEFETLSLPTLDDPGTLAPTVSLTVPDAPGQVAQPFSLTAGVSAGSPPLTYQWQMNGVDIPGATNAVYTLPYLLASQNNQTFAVTLTDNHGGTLHLGPTTLQVLGTQILANPGFEEGAGTPNWFWSNSASALQSPRWSHSGSWCSFQFSNSTLTSRTFTIPNDPGSVFASYWLLSQPQTNYLNATDSLTLSLVAADGTEVRTLRRHTSMDTDHFFWSPECFDISDLKGQTLTLKAIDNNVYGGTNFFLDDFGVASVDGATSLPGLQSFTPVSGGPGIQVTITGSGFSQVKGLYFGGIAAPFLVQSGTTLVATVPPLAITGPIRIVGLGGAFSSKTAFTVPAILSSFSPESGISGNTISILGRNFTGATVVSFNGMPAAFRVLSDSVISATVPVGATSGPISITGPIDTTQSTSIFTVEQIPVLTSFTPSSGAADTVVTLTGTGLTGATTVIFGAYASASFKVLSDTQIQATVPTSAATGLISASNHAGTVKTTTAFVVPAPTITSFSPTQGPVGTVVTLTGTGLKGTFRVEFGSNNSANIKVLSDTQVSAIVPSWATTGPITLSAPAGSVTSTGTFTIPGPTITSFSPSSGSPGTTVTVTGTGFLGTSGVTFNGSYAYPTVVSDTQLTVVVPGSATSGLIQVSTYSGKAISGGTFTVVPPTLQSFTPASGRLGTTVTITGTGLKAITGISFNNTTAYFQTASDTQITVVVPVGATTGPLSLQWNQGMLPSASPFTVTFPAPTITSFTPNAGAIGSSVTLTGTGFLGFTSVSFNGTPISYPYGNSDTTLTVNVPTGATTGPITLTTPGGSAKSANSFTVPGPVITSFSPGSGAPRTSVTLYGSGFSGFTTLDFNGTISTNAYANGDGSITAQVPNGATTGVITIKTPAGIAHSASSFTVNITPLSITSISPSSGASTSSVALTGTGFLAVTGVSFNGKPALMYSLTSDTQMTAYSPIGCTTGPITITSPYGSAQSSNSFTVLPAISFFTPNSGPVGTTVLLSGTGFTGVTGVAFGGVAVASYRVQDDTTITTVVPCGASSATLSVTTPAGTANSYYTFSITSGISGIVPTSGPVGTLVTLTGSGFTGATSVTFNGTAAMGFTIVNDNQITATVPGGALTGPIQITASIGVLQGRPFTVTVPPAGISAIIPTSGPVGTPVTLTGTGFTGATSVTFDGTAASIFTVVNDNQITATVPGGALTGPVQVATPRGILQSVSSFTVPMLLILGSPTPDNLMVGIKIKFSVIVTGSVDTGVLWTASGGTLDNPNGNPVTFTAPLTPGTVTLAVTSTADLTKSLTFHFPVGTADIKGDDTLDVLDMAMLASSLGLRVGDPRYLPAADLDGDGVITESDIVIFLKSF